MLGTPYFKQAKLHLENGKTVTISAPDNSEDHRYINGMTVNGMAYDKNYLTHDQLMGGAAISFQMGGQPNYRRGTAEDAFPYSFSNERKKK